LFAPTWQAQLTVRLHFSLRWSFEGAGEQRNERVSAAPARRRLSPEDRRNRIVEGAVAYFSEVGLEGTTRELSRRLGVTQSLLFNYFSTKADLIEAVYQVVYINRLSPDGPQPAAVGAAAALLPRVHGRDLHL
jgi:hypothetical protein